MRYQTPDSHRSHARAMRKDATKAENLLWQALRRSQLEGLTFRRQYTLDGYILDFVCFRPKMSADCPPLWLRAFVAPEVKSLASGLRPTAPHPYPSIVSP